MSKRVAPIEVLNTVYTRLLQCLQIVMPTPLYTAQHDAQLQSSSYNCLSYYSNNLANNVFATLSKTPLSGALSQI